MKKCASCNIDFNINENFCPLCQNKLVGNKDSQVFPSNIRLKTNTLILKWLLFISVTISIIVTFIEVYTSQKIWYSLFVIGGLFTNYIVIYYILKFKQDILKLFGKYGLILIILSLIWYIGTKNTFITNFIIPILCILELLFNLITFIVLRRNYIVNYLNLSLLNLLLVVVPIMLIIFKCTTFDILSYICIISALVVLMGLVIFYFDEIKMELKKIFNI